MVRTDHVAIRLLSAVLLLAGGALVGWAAVANAFGLDDAVGHVRRQIRYAWIGFVLLAAGVLVSPVRRGRLFGWIAAAPSASPGLCTRLGMGFGLLTGMVEVLHQSVRKLGGEILRQPLEFVWMAPLSYLVLFGVAGGTFAVGVRMLPRLLTLPVAVFSFAMLAAFSQCLFYPWHRVSMVILAVGVAVQVARWSAGHAPLLAVLSRRITPWLIVLVGLAAAGIPIVRSLNESSSMRALPSPEAGAPNVLLLVLDTVRADHTGVHGYARDTTPHIDGLAADAVVFDYAMTPSPWTLPAHATMFTGRYPFEVSADWLTPLDDAHSTLAEVMTANGYATGGFVGNLAYCLREHGVARGFARYEDYYIEPAVVGFSTAVGQRLMARTSGYSFNELIRNDAATVTDGFLGWLDEIGTERPFFAFLNYYDAHVYYIAPPPHDTQFGPKSPHIRAWYEQRWNEDARQGFVDAYDGCIAYIDVQIGRLMARLEELGILDHTVVIVTSDHGEQFWEHGLTEHGNSLYRPLLHVPLVIRDPRRNAPARVDDLVTLRDLPATVLGLAGIEAALPGHSLAHHWDASIEPPERPSPLLAEVSEGIGTANTPHTLGDMKAITAEGMHYILNGDGKEELYDFVGDPGEERNLIDDPQFAGVAARLRAAVAKAK